MHIFFVNGPPRSGKDTVGRILADHFGARVDKFARILKERTHALYGVFDKTTGRPVTHDFFELVKDEPQAIFLGLTPRQAYIHVSETYFKPVHGDAIFGKLLADELERLPADEFFGLHVITDSGFVGEAEELLRRWPDAEITLLQVEREGTGFDGDSRGYIQLNDPNATLEPMPVRTLRVLNNDTLSDLRNEVVRIAGPILGADIPDRYVLEVQVPGANESGGNPQWVQFGTADDLELALAKTESARRSHYAQRVVRITDRFGVDAIDLGERYIYPGDAPVYELEGATA